MDNIVGKTYNSLHPCHEIDIQGHKLSQNGHFVNKFLSLVAAILQHRFWAHVVLKSELAPDSGPGLESSRASTW